MRNVDSFARIRLRKVSSSPGKYGSNSGQNSAFLVATRGQLPNVSSVTLASAATGDSHIVRHEIADDCTEVSLVFTNDRVTTPIQLGSVALRVDGVSYPILFNGQRSSGLIEPGGEIQSDRLGINLSKGKMVYSLNYVKVSVDGHQYPTAMFGGVSVGEGKVVGVDVTRMATPTTPVSSGLYGPIGILGYSTKPKASIFIAGDSISYGVGDNDPYNGNPDGYGFIVRALNKQFGYFSIAKSGAVLPSTIQSHRLMPYITDAIINYGINNLATGSTFEQLKPLYLAYWGALVARGIKVYQCTIAPRTTSTDNWATAENQAPYNAVLTGGVNSERAKLNDWIRSGGDGVLSGYFDTADAIETSRNSGVWKPGMVYLADTQGVHPSVAGHAAMAAKIDTSKFL